MAIKRKSGAQKPFFVALIETHEVLAKTRKKKGRRKEKERGEEKRRKTSLSLNLQSTNTILYPSLEISLESKERERILDTSDTSKE
eukprot:scaffold16406_cov161-Skeletonema_menzelii.AAC.11